MPSKIKKIFEKVVWWSGVIMAGLILGISIQFVKAWTEPIEAPPNGNVGAPINTGDLQQNKLGVLGVGGLLTSFFNLGNPLNQPQVGNVLTVESVIPSIIPGGTDTAKVAWAEGSSSGTGSGCYVSYSDNCSEKGFVNKGNLGFFGSCNPVGGGVNGSFFLPPGGVDACENVSTEWTVGLEGVAYLCCISGS
jgi:hypothetical protein